MIIKYPNNGDIEMPSAHICTGGSASTCIIFHKLYWVLVKYAAIASTSSTMQIDIPG